MICSHFSIFETLETTESRRYTPSYTLWFALILVSLKHWKQPVLSWNGSSLVVICSHFSIFETLETTVHSIYIYYFLLWFALILVSLKHWKQLIYNNNLVEKVVICSHFSIFETLETTIWRLQKARTPLWFALILVSLKHWKQRDSII